MFPRGSKGKYQPDLTMIDISDLGLDLEDAGRMAQDEEPGTANLCGAIESGPDARITDVLAASVQGLRVGDKIDIESCFNAARPVFELPDTPKAIHSCRSLAVLEAGQTRRQDR